MKDKDRSEIPDYPIFKKIKWEHKSYIEKFNTQLLPYCDFSFSNLYIWKPDEFETELSTLNENLIIKTKNIQTNKINISLLGTNLIVETIKILLEDFGEISLFPDELLKFIPNEHFRILEDPNNHDYILSTERISALEGKRFLSKRKRINKFQREYPNSKVMILDNSDKNKLTETVLGVFQKWKSSKKNFLNYNEQTEVTAIKRLMDIANYSDIEIWTLEIDGETKAFTTIEYVNKEYAISSFAKSDLSYPDANVYLTYKTAEYLHNVKNVEFLNHEQDLGIINLRSEKLSWRPVNLLKKYIIKNV